jgi:hypothetical protein
VKLIPEFASAWRLFSVQGAVVLAVLQGLLASDPNALDFIEPHWRHGIMLMVALYAGFGRIIHQTPPVQAQIPVAEVAAADVSPAAKVADASSPDPVLPLTVPAAPEPQASTPFHLV